MFGLAAGGIGLGGARKPRMTVDAAEFGQSKATFAGRKKGMTVAKRKLDFDDSDDDVPTVKKAIPPKRITAPAIVN